MSSSYSAFKKFFGPFFQKKDCFYLHALSHKRNGNAIAASAATPANQSNTNHRICRVRINGNALQR